jgi:hypothetical protein
MFPVIVEVFFVSNDPLNVDVLLNSNNPLKVVRGAELSVVFRFDKNKLSKYDIVNVGYCVNLATLKGLKLSVGGF